jgi:pimeloyl-ACP methyl ester carboxylesterase
MLTVSARGRATISAALAATALTVGTVTSGAASPPGDSVASARGCATPKPPTGFSAHDIPLNGITMHYVIGGHGPTLVLLHGYPETSHEWFGVLPQLAERFTVIAPDLRGAGGSSAPAAGYDKATMAADVHALLAALHRTDDVRVVGHDIGTMVAYSYAAHYRDETAKLVLSEAPIPDSIVYTYPSLTKNGPGFWNFGFFSLTNGLPEKTIDGHESRWVEGFTDWLEVQKGSITPTDVRTYACALRDDAHLKASLEWFRAFPTDNADVARTRATPLTMPVLALGADHSLGLAVADQARSYAADVTGAVIADSGHWIWEEQPAQTTDLVLKFLLD